MTVGVPKKSAAPYPSSTYTPKPSMASEMHTADVPLSQLQGSAPFTVYLNGNHVWTTDLDGNAARIEFVWEYHVVLQRLP